MSAKILIQLDPDPHPSVFDAVVAIDAGVDHLLRHSSVRPEQVRDLAHGALFTRGPKDLQNTALFIGGSDVAAAEALLQAARDACFGPFRVSMLFDANGCNTTAAAAVLAAIDGAKRTRGDIDGTVVTILAGTGPVGQRVARLLVGLNQGVQVRLCSRTLDRAQTAARAIEERTGQALKPMATGGADELRAAVADADLVIAAGAAGVSLLPKSVATSARVLIDLNAVPPAGVEIVDARDRATERDGVLTWGALGVGATKMKIHKKAIEALFEANDKIIDAEECLGIGRSLT